MKNVRVHASTRVQIRICTRRDWHGTGEHPPLSPRAGANATWVGSWFKCMRSVPLIAHAILQLGRFSLLGVGARHAFAFSCAAPGAHENHAVHEKHAVHENLQCMRSMQYMRKAAPESDSVGPVISLTCCIAYRLADLVLTEAWHREERRIERA
jgi:hypothetical protein